MRLEHCFSHVVLPVALATGLLTGSGLAQSRTTLPDSQVQANVLRSLAAAPELSSAAVNSATVNGVVTLSGSVQTEAERRKAEQLASTTPGVQRVVDELTLGSSQGGASASQGGVLQSDGTYAEVGNDAAALPSQSGAQPGQAQQIGNAIAQPGQDEVPPANGPDTDPYGRPLNGQAGESQQSARQQNGSLSEQQGLTQQPAYGQGQPDYGQPYGLPQMRQAPPMQGPPYGQSPQQGNNQPYRRGYGQGYGPGAGQVGGQAVTVPSGTVIRVRVNQHLSSRDINIGTPFDAVVENDIVANGQVAIPRGAFVQGTVVDAERSGRLKGRGELGLQLNQVTLGGRVYPIVSDTFSAHGGDKTIQTVNTTAGLGALGAIFGAVAGGGVGAAIGAGVGGAAGLGASAASGRGDVFIPSEAVLSFRLTQPSSVTTVSQAEMQRLASNAPQGRPMGGPQFVRRYPYPYPYVGPVYYGPRYYRPYGYAY